MHSPVQCFQNTPTYFAISVNYARIMFMKLTLVVDRLVALPVNLRLGCKGAMDKGSKNLLYPFVSYEEKSVVNMAPGTYRAAFRSCLHLAPAVDNTSDYLS
jgi:hypothetical protein